MLSRVVKGTAVAYVMARRSTRRARHRQLRAGGAPVGKGEAMRHCLSALLTSQGGRCFWCACLVSQNPDSAQYRTLDHHIPLSRGGKHIVSNLRVVCLRCNREKGNLLPGEYASQKSQELL